MLSYVLLLKAKKTKISIAVPIFLRTELTIKRLIVTVISGKKSRNITAQILKYAILFLSRCLCGNFSTAENCHHMACDHSWWLYRRVEQPAVLPAVNMPAWLLLYSVSWSPVELRFSVEWGLYFSRWSKDHLGTVHWKRGNISLGD